MTPCEIDSIIRKLSCIAPDDLEELYVVYGEDVTPEYIVYLHGEYPNPDDLRDFYLCEIRRMMEWGIYTLEHLKHDFNIVP